MTIEAPRTAAELGLMQDSLPPPEGRVTFWNWESPPFNRWSFQRVASLVPTARIWRGEGPVSTFEQALVPLGNVAVRTAAGDTVAADAVLRQTCSDGFLVLHHGRIAEERYFNGMRPHTRHLLMSVSKSMIGTLAGVVIGRGLLDEGDAIADVVAELRGTSFEGATVRHLLDMSAGTLFVEDYEDPASDARQTDWIACWGPPPPGRESPGLYDYIASLANTRQHGVAFEYRSILTDVLGWVLARAAGTTLPELLGEALWAPLGPEEDAEVTVDRHGGPWVDGGICAALRDLARFGQMHLQEGCFNGRQVVPAAWVRDTRVGGPESREAFAGSVQHGRLPLAFYRNQWWVLRPDDGVYLASGIYGQFVYIDVPADVVVVKVSSLPAALDESVWADQVALFDAVAAALREVD